MQFENTNRKLRLSYRITLGILFIDVISIIVNDTGIYWASSSDKIAAISATIPILAIATILSPIIFVPLIFLGLLPAAPSFYITKKLSNIRHIRVFLKAIVHRSAQRNDVLSAFYKTNDPKFLEIYLNSKDKYGKNILRLINVSFTFILLVFLYIAGSSSRPNSIRILCGKSGSTETCFSYWSFLPVAAICTFIACIALDIFSKLDDMAGPADGLSQDHWERLKTLKGKGLLKTKTDAVMKILQKRQSAQ
ncbi:hypothetical protein [Roseobacter sp. HKCCA0434]|uniref:hypothetical protein n=1 Tax=Roseobacter sp. HKCCA0434 TaxID=3079297 RepID=UPI002905E366|nr:hypothetical protein [Roseobacter sp. HKCCA0434]